MSANTSARHIFETLREVCAAGEPLRVSDLRRRSGQSASTTQRALRTLTRAGYLKRLEYLPKYRIGPTAERLSNAVLERFKLRAASLVYLRELAVSSRCTAFLYVRLGWYGVRLIGVEADPGRVPPASAPRSGNAALLTARGATLAILAHLPDDEVERCLRFAAAHRNVTTAAQGTATATATAAATTAASHPTLGARLAAIRADGHAYEPAVKGGRMESIAFPLRDPQGSALGSLAIEASPGEQRLLDSPLRPEWQRVVRDLEAEIRSNPAFYANPFAHLDPDRIRFGIRTHPPAGDLTL